jgi:hypothetical protein
MFTIDIMVIITLLEKQKNIDIDKVPKP